MRKSRIAVLVKSFLDGLVCGFVYEVATTFFAFVYLPESPSAIYLYLFLGAAMFATVVHFLLMRKIESVITVVIHAVSSLFIAIITFVLLISAGFSIFPAIELGPGAGLGLIGFVGMFLVISLAMRFSVTMLCIVRAIIRSTNTKQGDAA